MAVNSDLFDNGILPSDAPPLKGEPLASRMRPRTLDEVVGQEHIIAPGTVLYRSIKGDLLSSIIFYGPPGCGKTTLALVIASETHSQFRALNAVLSGVADIRAEIARATDMRRLHSLRTVLFVDEIHRWNKSQQDSLLHHIEDGTIILVGATTENPYHEINRALVSRSRIFELKKLTPTNLATLAKRALSDKDRGLGSMSIEIDDDALDHLIAHANGDARNLLNALELAASCVYQPEGGQAKGRITLEIATGAIQRKALSYDNGGDYHYDCASAFIKSLRGSSPDAALFWLAKMVLSGEDPHFIFRRMLILASEDVGLACPDAIRVVVSCAQAFDYVGLPEGKYHLALAALFLAICPKSDSVNCYFDAESFVENYSGNIDVPDHLKDKTAVSHTDSYKYPHNYPNHWVSQQYLPNGVDATWFKFNSLGWEKKAKDWAESLKMNDKSHTN